MGSLIYSEKMGGLISNMVETHIQVSKLIQAYKGQIYVNDESGGKRAVTMSWLRHALNMTDNTMLSVGDVSFYCLDEDTNEYIGPFFPYSATVSLGKGITANDDGVSVRAGKGITADDDGVSVKISKDKSNELYLLEDGLCFVGYDQIGLTSYSGTWGIAHLECGATFRYDSDIQKCWITGDGAGSGGLCTEVQNGLKVTSNVTGKYDGSSDVIEVDYDTSTLGLNDTKQLTLSSDMMAKIVKYDQLLEDFETLKAEVEALKSSD